MSTSISPIEINHQVLGAFLNWVRNTGRISLAIIFTYVCHLGKDMFGEWPISRILELPRPSHTLWKNSRKPVGGLLREAEKLRARSERFLHSIDFWDEEEADLEIMEEPETFWWSHGAGFYHENPEELEEKIYELFLGADPHRIYDFSLNDLGAREVDLALESLLPKPQPTSDLSIDRAFEKYVEERDIYVNLREKGMDEEDISVYLAKRTKILKTLTMLAKLNINVEVLITLLHFS